jgi:hypothetical protein
MVYTRYIPCLNFLGFPDGPAGPASNVTVTVRRTMSGPGPQTQPGSARRWARGLRVTRTRDTVRVRDRGTRVAGPGPRPGPPSGWRHQGRAPGRDAGSSGGRRPRHQQIGIKLLAIIGFTPLLLVLAIIGYYCNYWLLLVIIFLQKVFISLAIIATSSNIIYCNYCDTIIAIIGSASNYLHYWQLLAIIDINLIIGINLN